MTRKALLLLTSAGILAATLSIRHRPDPDHRRARRTGLDRSAFHRDRHPCRDAQARVRHAGLVGRRAGDRAAPRDKLEGGRSDDVGVQAAAEREIPRRLGLHRRGREVLDHAHADPDGAEPDHDLCPPREGGADARSAHRARRHRRSGAEPAERFHPAVHRVAQGRSRRHEGERERGVQLRQGRGRHRTVQVRLVDPEGRLRRRALRRILGRQGAVGTHRAQGNSERRRARRAAQGRASST